MGEAKTDSRNDKDQQQYAMEQSSHHAVWHVSQRDQKHAV